MSPQDRAKDPNIMREFPGAALPEKSLREQLGLTPEDIEKMQEGGREFLRFVDELEQRGSKKTLRELLSSDDPETKLYALAQLAKEYIKSSGWNETKVAHYEDQLEALVAEGIKKIGDQEALNKVMKGIIALLEQGGISVSAGSGV